MFEERRLSAWTGRRMLHWVWLWAVHPPYRTYRFPIGPCQLTPTPVLLTRSLIRPRRSLTHSPQLTPTPFLLTRPPIHSRQLTHRAFLLTHALTHSLTPTHPYPTSPPHPLARSLADSLTYVNPPRPRSSSLAKSLTRSLTDTNSPPNSSSLAHAISRRLTRTPVLTHSHTLAHSLTPTRSYPILLTRPLTL